MINSSKNRMFENFHYEIGGVFFSFFFLQNFSPSPFLCLPDVLKPLSLITHTYTPHTII